MSGSSLRVAKYIIENPQRVALMSIVELAGATGSSKSCIVRVSKMTGYQGYRGLRAALMENRGLLRGTSLVGLSPPSGVEGDNNVLNLAREVIRINIEVLQDTTALLDPETLLRTADTLLKAKHVFLVGFGTSAPVIEDTYQRFLRLRIASSTCSDAHILASIVVNLGSDDLLFCISYSGASRDVIEALETAKQRGTPTITLTSVPRSAAVQLSDIALISAVRRTPRAAESVAARVAQLVVIDIICAIIALRREDEVAESNKRMEAELSKKRI
jgi:DNA-binding MurR/RpiR family transcriptional regulator